MSTFFRSFSSIFLLRIKVSNKTARAGLAGLKRYGTKHFKLAKSQSPKRAALSKNEILNKKMASKSDAKRKGEAMKPLDGILHSRHDNHVNATKVLSADAQHNCISACADLIS